MGPPRASRRVVIQSQVAPRDLRFDQPLDREASLEGAWLRIQPLPIGVGACPAGEVRQLDVW